VNNVIIKDIDVRYMDTAFTVKTSLTALLSYFNEVAQVAGDYYAGERDIYKRDHLAWILVNWQVLITRFPAYRERLHLVTVAHAIDRFYAYRSFYVKDTSGNTIAEGKSRWVLMDFSAKRATEAKEDMWALYGVERGTPAFDVELPYPLKTEHFRVTYRAMPSDIDIYNHVNNVVYARWICDALEPDVRNGRQMKEFRILYKKEIYNDEEVFLLSQIDADNELRTRHIFRDAHGVNLAYASTKWELEG